jgi:hypothetical protein
MKKEKAKDIIKRNLWMRGYAVKDVSEYTGYDLMVTSKQGKRFRVLVIGSQTDEFDPSTDAFDIIATVVGTRKVYATKQEILDWAIQDKKLKFNKKPQEVFK